MARIDIEIEDYLDEVETKYLIRELEKRHDVFKYKSDIEALITDVELPEFKTPELLLCYIKKLLRLKPWHDKERIIKEINEL